MDNGKGGKKKDGVVEKNIMSKENKCREEREKRNYIKKNLFGQNSRG